MRTAIRPLLIPAALLLGAVSLAGCSAESDTKEPSTETGEISFSETLEAAENGDAVAQYNLAQMYHEGMGIEVDREKAAVWHRKAAEQGLADAQYNLARAYVTGSGVTQDYDEAKTWYRKAAAQGDTSAQYNLGVMAGKGVGAPRDNAEAVKWFRMASSRGHAKAHFNLAVLLARGEGAKQDLVEAHTLFTLAAKEAELAQQATEFRTDVENEMTPDQIAQARDRAVSRLRER